MQELNRHNIEAWLLDYQEGRLDGSQIIRLKEFLAEHDDLPVDPDFADFISLEAPVIRFDRKDELYRTDLSVPEATEDELECIAAFEGDLAEGQQEHFDERLRRDTSLAALYAQFARARLQPSSDIRMRDKSKLYRKTLRLPAYVYGAVATAAMVIIAFFIFRPDGVPTLPDQDLIAADTTREIIYMNKLIHPGSFDQIAAQEPAKLASTKRNQVVPESRDVILMAALAPKGAGGIEYSFPASQFEIITRPDPFASDIPYQTLWAYSGELIRKNILGQDPQQVKKNKFSLWEVADAGLQKASDVFSIAADLDRHYNDEGELVEVSFDSPLLAFTTPVNTRKAQ